jgi:hypothetical protein
MNAETLNEAWVKQAQLDADRDVIECRVCKVKRSLESTITLWLNGGLVFAVCHHCTEAHDIVMRPTERGVEVRARSRRPLIVGARG